ncbi:MAG: hypothetical protein D8M57_12510 [Candidatus Scalindua sp. AMX11]|nr:MAG: hypothetical protein DWQ00_00140 [Candidatus Scalindua sp.]NOG83195.1 hypothetical protein [Planctomycetota bacterium]RZV77560.1 MAG: hypothetical protein EX341_11660 [Candidatus Scalindua sp. SCAELEC01]TDE64560.1 MAG: hypothetical protein D8M57_12510 [Candidatus Scalindua sp. AMX11]GJQ58626.1 MAG: hypothetical protein SCALA701_14270 [Candidatus Scalindua sp.]
MKKSMKWFRFLSVIVLSVACFSTYSFSYEVDSSSTTTGGDSILVEEEPVVTPPSGEAVEGAGNSLDARDGDPTDVVFVDDIGNVGFNTVNPETDIHLSSKNENFTSIRLEGNSSRDGSYREHTTIVRDAHALRFIDDDGGEVFTILEHTQDSSNRLGEIGIHTGSPEVDFHIYTIDEKSTSIRLEGNSSRDGSYREHTTITRDADALRFIDDDRGEVFTILEHGEVGINTTAPTEELEVNGDIKATTFYSLKGVTSMLDSGQTEAIFDINDEAVWKVFVFGGHAVAEAAVFGSTVKMHEQSPSSTFNESKWLVFREQGSIKVKFTDVHDLSDRARWVAIRVM